MNNYLLFDFTNMSVINHFKPNKTRIKIFLIVFLLFIFLNILIIYRFGPFWDRPLSIGYPVDIYKLGCGMSPLLTGAVCLTGFSALGLLINVIFWYLVSTFIKRSK